MPAIVTLAPSSDWVAGGTGWGGMESGLWEMGNGKWDMGHGDWLNAFAHHLQHLCTLQVHRDKPP